MHAGDYIEPITNTSVQLAALMTKEETQHPRLRGLSEAPLLNTLVGTLPVNTNNVGCSYYALFKNKTAARLYGNHIDLAAHFPVNIESNQPGKPPTTKQIAEDIENIIESGLENQ